ncbi:probable G-protein coupled receptor 174 [Chanos chanos]|uniref:Probable G-protein coupled receptor 174 n=1 Tax=Chanos chanos TaxID=29144 RepID=A0A6J2UMA3_CHACN|nr:probable G-protein coupled receptor 174 [Chanos chanos]
MTCPEDDALRKYQHHIYAIIYAVILVPGLIGNTLALWVFHAYVKETKKAVIFMINLAIADLLQVLSLPLRIYYYLNDSWPFGHFFCMFSFYLKYVNMYASIFFLTCISVRRCRLIIYPLRFNTSKRWRDRTWCALGWFLVCLGCLPFPLLRRGNGIESNGTTRCFSELPMVTLDKASGLSLLTVAELMGFLLPLAVVLTCTWLTAGSLREKNCVLHDLGEKSKALKMVLSCTCVFLICFVPYHITFPLDFLAKSAMVSCTFRSAILHCHPLTLCLASLNSCLDPVMYYFTTDEFKRRLSRPELSESFQLARRISCATNEEKPPETEDEGHQRVKAVPGPHYHPSNLLEFTTAGVAHHCSPVLNVDAGDVPSAASARSEPKPPSVEPVSDTGLDSHQRNAAPPGLAPSGGVSPVLRLDWHSSHNSPGAHSSTLHLPTPPNKIKRKCPWPLPGTPHLSARKSCGTNSFYFKLWIK